MPATSPAEWEDLAGYRCAVCDINPATHFYGAMLLCCQCHTGSDEGIYTPAEALREHTRVLLRRCEAGE